MGNSKKIQKELAPRLIKWHKKNNRDFPWRHTKDPYQILIAEILLQRTKAEQVAPVYNNFLKKYPTVKALAKGRIKTIENIIRPLGLLKRGRMLKQLGREILDRHKGDVPQKTAELLKLMLVGNYVANAVSCFSYDRDFPTVDWNAARVFSRIVAYPLKSAPHADKDFIDFVSEFIPNGKGREFNLALLDFSASVCIPRKPLCDECPLNSFCIYNNSKSQGDRA